MSGSPSEDNQEIAENILNRIFYEETTHDRVINILRTYKDQGFAYLDACTELAYVFLRMLEQYSKQNVDLQVRSRRRARKKRRERAGREVDDSNDQSKDDEVSEAEDVAEVQRAAKERKFDFNRFSARFILQGSVDTFVAFTRFYKELNAKQLKRAHRFFYRVAFKMEMSVLLFRVDIIKLFYTMIKGPQELDREVSCYKEWEELVRHIFRNLTKTLQERPELMVEMLFSKMSSSLFFLEHGYDKELPKKTPRLPAELEIKGLETASEKVAVTIAMLLKENKNDDLAWIKGVIESALEERKAWEQAEEARAILEQSAIDGTTEQDLNPQPENTKAPLSICKSINNPQEAIISCLPSQTDIKPDSDQRRIALSRDNKLQLLLKLLDFERISADDDTNATWIIPSSSYPTSSRLEEALQQLVQHETTPIELPDGKSVEEFIHVKRKPAASRIRRAEFDDEDDNDNDQATSAINTENEDGEPLFPAGGPTTRPSDPLDKDLNKQRRRRRRLAKPGDIDDADAEAARAQRSHARQRAEASKRHKIKSDLFVHGSDDEDDAERDDAFFAMEESRRKGFGRQIDTVLGKRGSPIEDDDDDDDNEDVVQREQSAEIYDTVDAVGDVQVSRKKSRRKGAFSSENVDAADVSYNDMNGSTSAIDGLNDTAMISDASPTNSRRGGIKSNRKRLNRKRNRIRNTDSDDAINDTSSSAILHNALSPNVIKSGNNNQTDDFGHSNSYDSDTPTNTDSDHDTTPLSSQGAEEYEQGQQAPENHIKNEILVDVEEGKENHDASQILRKDGSIRRRNVRAGFVIDSDSD